MKSIILPHSDCKVSILALGTADFGLKSTEAEAHALLDRFVASGGTLIDTARIYSDWVPGEIGRSERIIGDWLTKSGTRNHLVISTKGAHPYLDSMDQPRLKPADIISDVDKSIAALKVDTIDLYYLHRDDIGTPVSEIIDALEQCVRAGKIRYIACSNWTERRMVEALRYSERTGSCRFLANQVHWNIGSAGMKPKTDPTIVTMDRNLLASCNAEQVAVAAFSSMATGYFMKMCSGIESEIAKAEKSAYHTDLNRELLSWVRNCATDTGLSVEAVVLGYLLSRNQQVIAVIGPRNLEQLNAALNAAEAELSETQIQEIDELNGFSSQPRRL